MSILCEYHYSFHFIWGYGEVIDWGRGIGRGEIITILREPTNDVTVIQKDPYNEGI